MTTASWLLLALAGGLGAVARSEVDSRVGTAVAARGDSHRRRPGQTPVALGTAVVNVSACLLLGLLTGVSASFAPTLVTVLGTGFLGGYSTFSTACVEAARLVLSGRPRAGFLHAATMAGTSLLAAVGGLVLGAAIVA